MYRLYMMTIPGEEGILLPEYRGSGQVENWGDIDALTNPVLLPGRGYFDPYGRDPHPTGAQAIVKECEIFGDDWADVLAQVDALRSAAGRRVRLTYQFSSGELRWEWAILKKVGTPVQRGYYHSATVTMVFEGTEQQKYRIIQGSTAPTWGSGSAKWGDGTTVWGMSDATATLAASPQAVTLTHSGNVECRNLQLLISVPAAGDAISFLTIKNATASNNTKITYDGSTLPIAEGEHLYIRNGPPRCLHLAADQAITDIAQDGITTTLTVAGHGHSAGDKVRVSGTPTPDDNDGVFTITGATTNTLSYKNRWGRAETPTVAILNKATDAWAYLTPAQVGKWLTLTKGGANSLSVTYTGNAAGTATLAAEWWDHYA